MKKWAWQNSRAALILWRSEGCIDFMEKRGLTVGRRGWKVILLAINNEPTELLGRHLFFIRAGPQSIFGSVPVKGITEWPPQDSNSRLRSFWLPSWYHLGYLNVGLFCSGAQSYHRTVSVRGVTAGMGRTVQSLMGSFVYLALGG